MIKPQIILSFVILFGFSMACLFHHPGKKGYLEIRQIEDKNQIYDSPKVLEKFQSFSPNEQLDIYLFARKYVEGGGGDISQFISKDFDKLMPFIAEKIRTSETIEDKTELLGLYSYPNDKLLKGHPEIVKILTDSQPQIIDTDDEETKNNKRNYIKELARLNDFLNT